MAIVAVFPVGIIRAELENVRRMKARKASSRPAIGAICGPAAKGVYCGERPLAFCVGSFVNMFGGLVGASCYVDDLGRTVWPG
jgi:hypothetical protein